LIGLWVERDAGLLYAAATPNYSWRNNMIHTSVVIVEQEEEGYYPYLPILETDSTRGDSLEEILPDIWEAVARYLETISGEATRSYP